jgi:hypothetical protein
MTRGLCLAWLLTWSLMATAAPQPLDDSGSQVVSAERQMQWRTPLPGAGEDHEVLMNLVVDLRLNTRRWSGRAVRIHMLLEPDEGPEVEARWSAQQGRLLDGRVVSGGRALIYSGTLSQAVLEDRLSIQLRTDGRWMTPQRRLNFTYEIDEL